MQCNAMQWLGMPWRTEEVKNESNRTKENDTEHNTTQHGSTRRNAIPHDGMHVVSCNAMQCSAVQCMPERTKRIWIWIWTPSWTKTGLPKQQRKTNANAKRMQMQMQCKTKQNRTEQYQWMVGTLEIKNRTGTRGCRSMTGCRTLYCIAFQYSTWRNTNDLPECSFDPAILSVCLCYTILYLSVSMQRLEVKIQVEVEEERTNGTDRDFRPGETLSELQWLAKHSSRTHNVRLRCDCLLDRLLASHMRRGPFGSVPFDGNAPAAFDTICRCSFHQNNLDEWIG